ncbi:uncharacterized protein LOC135400616 [Ornithodoros turicata]|uniref:uncharacterized protein LOC135400616 n=1 Tax=Ornithodoros turicata TaxID=34597 RepID=UPI003139D395
MRTHRTPSVFMATSAPDSSSSSRRSSSEHPNTTTTSNDTGARSTKRMITDDLSNQRRVSSPPGYAYFLCMGVVFTIVICLYFAFGGPSYYTKIVSADPSPIILDTRHFRTTTFFPRRRMQLTRRGRRLSENYLGLPNSVTTTPRMLAGAAWTDNVRKTNQSTARPRPTRIVSTVTRARIVGMSSASTVTSSRISRAHVPSTEIYGLRRSAHGGSRDPPQYSVVCQFNHTSYKRKKPMAFRAEDVPLRYCSHVVYSSVQIEADLSLSSIGNKSLNETAMKMRHPHTSILTAIGARHSRADVINRMCTTRGHIFSFAATLDKWLRQRSYDGILLDFRYNSEGSIKDCMTSLMAAIRHKIRRNVSLWLALSADDDKIERQFDFHNLARYVDMFFVLPDMKEGGPRSIHSFPDVISAVSRLQRSLQKEESIMAQFCFALHIGGRSYTLTDKYDGKGPTVPFGTGSPGYYTDRAGLLAYYEICSKNWTQDVRHAFFSYVAEDDQWIEYLSPSNIERTLEVILGDRVMSCIGISDVSLDDFAGVCGEKFKLTKTVAGSTIGIAHADICCYPLCLPFDMHDRRALVPPAQQISPIYDYNVGDVSHHTNMYGIIPKIGSFPPDMQNRSHSDRYKSTVFHAIVCIGAIFVLLMVYLAIVGRRYYGMSDNDVNRPYTELNVEGAPYVSGMNLRPPNAANLATAASESTTRPSQSPENATTNASGMISETYVYTSSDVRSTTVRGKNSTSEEIFSFPTASGPTSHSVACIFNHTSYRRRKPMAFRVGHIPAPYCSHIIYYSAGIGQDFSVISRDRDFDIVQDGFNKFAHLKRIYPHLSVLVAIGGQLSDSKRLSAICQSQETMAIFAINVKTWLSQYDYDGVVIHWQHFLTFYKAYLHSLLKVLRQAFGPYHSIWLAVPDDHELRRRYFNVPSLAPFVDKFFVVPQVMEGKLSNKTLFPDLLSDVLNVRHSLAESDRQNLYNKFCFGMYIGGKSYTLVHATVSGDNAVVAGHGEPGPYTRSPGMLAYYEFCDRKFATTVRGTLESHVAERDQWICYLDAANIVKVLWVALWKHRASCVGVWDVTLDDFRGVCGQRFVLTRAVAGWKAYDRARTYSTTVDMPAEVQTLIRDTSDVNRTPPGCGCLVLMSMLIIIMLCVFLAFGGRSYYSKSSTSEPSLIPHGNKSHLDDSSDGTTDGVLYLRTNARAATSLVRRNELKLRSASPNHSKTTTSSKTRTSTPLIIEDQNTTSAGVTGATGVTTKDELLSKTFSTMGYAVKSQNQAALPTRVPPSYRVVCRYNHSSYRRKWPMTFGPEDIPARYCSHVVCSSAYVTSDYTLVSVDDVELNETANCTELKRKHPHIFILIAIEPDTTAPDVVDSMCKVKEGIAEFARNVRSWFARSKCDGVLLDLRQRHERSLKDRFTSLVAAVRHKISSNHSLWLTIPNDDGNRQQFYDLHNLARYVDNFFIFSQPGDDALASMHAFPVIINDVHQMRHRLEIQADTSFINKFCFALSVGGTSYTLRRRYNYGTSRYSEHVWMEPAGPGGPGPYTDHAGLLAYYEICTRNWTAEVHHAFFSYVTWKNMWVEYLDPSNIERILDAIVGGREMSCIGISDVSLDDFRGVCGEEFALTKAVAGWRRYVADTGTQ